MPKLQAVDKLSSAEGYANSVILRDLKVLTAVLSDETVDLIQVVIAAAYNNGALEALNRLAKKANL